MTSLKNMHCLTCNYDGKPKRGKRPVSKTPYGTAVIIFLILGIFFTPALFIVVLLFIAVFISMIFRLLGPVPLQCPKCKTKAIISSEDWHIQND